MGNTDFNTSDMFNSASDAGDLAYILDVAKLVLELTDPDLDELQKLLSLKHYVNRDVISVGEAAQLWCYRDVLDQLRQKTDTDSKQ